jgi:hypothetical protein
MLEFVFGLPSPAAFPTLPKTPKKADLEALKRYIHAAEELAQSELLNGRNEMTVHVPDESEEQEQVETTFSSNEITRGFTVLFRQFHSKEKAILRGLCGSTRSCGKPTKPPRHTRSRAPAPA